MKTIRRIFCLLAIVSIISAVVACNTAKGFGRDVEKLGKKMSGSK